MRKFGPKAADHVTVGKKCPLCGVAFKPGDYTTLIVKGPADMDEQRKRDAGGAYTAEAAEVHWECAQD